MLQCEDIMYHVSCFSVHAPIFHIPPSQLTGRSANLFTGRDIMFHVSVLQLTRRSVNLFTGRDQANTKLVLVGRLEAVMG